MYTLNIAPGQVQQTLSQHILADGFDLTLDIKRSLGVRFYDSKYQRNILDFFTCFASMPIGYNHPKMVNDEVFRENLLLAAMANPSNSDVYTEQYAQFVETFARVGIPEHLPHAFFIAGGALAVENAIKVAMDWKVQKNFAKGYRQEKGFKVIHFEEAFHGRSGYTMSLTNTDPTKVKWFAKFPDWPRIVNPKLNFPLTDASLAETIRKEQLAISQISTAFREFPDDICAIIIEPIQSEGGDNHFRKEFLVALRNLCLENEALLIYDEVQTGVALTGKFWCHEHFGAEARPDLLAFGKKMQVCGILGGTRIDEVETNCFKVPSRINSTWGGNLTDMVRSSKVLEIIEEDGLVAHVASEGFFLHEQVKALADEFPYVVANPRGRGFQCAFDLPDAGFRSRLINHALGKYHTMFLGCGQRSIRFRPPLIMSHDEIAEGMEVLRKTLRDLNHI